MACEDLIKRVWVCTVFKLQFLEHLCQKWKPKGEKQLVHKMTLVSAFLKDWAADLGKAAVSKGTWAASWVLMLQ